MVARRRGRRLLALSATARPAGAPLEGLEADLQRYVVLPFDVALARICGQVLADRELAGQKMEEFDAWITASAVRHDIPLATNNRKHFEGSSGLRLIDPAAA